MTSRRLLPTLIALSMVAVLSTTALAAVAIRTVGQDWSPARVRVERGTRVVWRSAGNHNVTAYGGNWTFFQDISPSEDPTASKVFRRRGTFRFFCRFHAIVSDGVCHGMCGRVRVTRRT